MSFVLFTDSCSNLPGQTLKDLDIRVLPCSYSIDGKLIEYSGNIDEFDAHAHYDLLRSGKMISTSLLNTGTFLDHFRPVLEQGLDIVYVGLSAGISGTIHAAQVARAELLEEFPERVIRIVDSMGAGLGTGILTCKGADFRAEGLNANAVADRLDALVPNLCEFFTVENLMFLKRTGRVSAATAMIGTMLNIKPLLRGDETGHITNCAKLRGRAKSIEAILQKYQEKVQNAAMERVAISHGDCPEEAEYLAQKVMEIAKPKELIICPHEPFTGSHVGPGMLGLFFFGTAR